MKPTLLSIAALACGPALTSQTLAGPGTPGLVSPLGYDTARADAHAPVGVMGDHTHDAGGFMLSYRFMFMPMETNYAGNDSVSDASVLKDYMVVPTSMDMYMHMAGFMYAPTDKLSLSLMAPYSQLTMDHRRRDGTSFTTESDGWGDVSLTGLVKVADDLDARFRAHLNLGVGLPTGETDASDEIPGLGETRLPYPMQLGSGSWSIRPGFTLLKQYDAWSWGAQVLGRIHLDDNDEGYRLGDSIEASLWAAYAVTDRVSTSFRVSGRSWGDIDGADRYLRVPAAAVPTADPSLRGGAVIELGLGLNYVLGGGHRLGIEALVPVYRDLDGPQLGSDWTLQAGWQFSF